MLLEIEPSGIKIWLNNMDYIVEVTEESINELTHKYYRGDTEIKVGDKIIFAFVEERIDKITNMIFKSFVLDGNFFYELKEEKV
jgi:hypothetical protein